MEETLARIDRLSILGAGTQALGQVAGGVAALRSSSYRAALYRQDALAKQLAAQQATERGQFEAQFISREASQIVGEQTAALAANGIEVGRDSALDLVAESAGIGAVDALLALTNAENKARSFRNAARVESARAELESSRGRQSLLTSFGGAAQTILGGASTVANRRLQFNRGE